MKRTIIALIAGLLAGSGGQAAAKPLKVYILAGQSNMQGHVNVSTFDSMADDPKTAPILKEMRGADGKPHVCQKVWISSIGCAGDDTTEQKGPLTAGFGASPAEIGPEFTFGLYMQKLDEPILIIKTSWGGKSLHTDFRPPGAGPYVWSDFELKRRKATIEKEKADKLKDTGVFYRLMITHVQKVLGDVKQVMPEYDPKQGYELAGFVWFQGFNDLVSDWTYDKGSQPGGYDLYGQLLAQFIRDVRKDLSAPTMPFVIGVMGIGGLKAEQKPGRQMYFRQAQAAPALLPEFKGNVVAVQTAPYWDDELEALQARVEACWPKVDARVAAEKDTSWANKMRVMAENFTPEEWKRLKGASNGGYHYLGAAKIMAPIGKAFAETIVNQMGRTLPESALAEPGPSAVGLLHVKGGRFLTLNTVIRVNQIEAARDVNEGIDDGPYHTPEAVAAFRDAVSKGFPDGAVTWAFSWQALHDQRPNYVAIRKQVVNYHKVYGDEITFNPGGYFAPMYSSRAQVNRDLKEALMKVREMVGDGYKPKSIVAGFLAAENLRYLAEEEGIHVCQGTIWSQYGIDNGDGDGSISYPYYPSREHVCKPAQGKRDFIDCVNLDGWTCDFLCARRFGFEDGFNSRLGVGPIESYRNLGVEKGMAEVMAVTANHFDDAYKRNGFGWVANCWEVCLVKALQPEVLECLTEWLQNVRLRWPGVRLVTQGEFGEAWRRDHPDNQGLDYRFVQRGTGIGGSEANLEIRWYMNADFRLALLRDWKTNEPAKVIDFTRYDLPAREPADPTPGHPSRNWSLINRISQKHQRPEDTPVPLSALTQEEQALVRKHYPDLF